MHDPQHRENHDHLKGLVNRPINSLDDPPLISSRGLEEATRLLPYCR